MVIDIACELRDIQMVKTTDGLQIFLVSDGEYSVTRHIIEEPSALSINSIINVTVWDSVMNQFGFVTAKTLLHRVFLPPTVRKVAVS